MSLGRAGTLDDNPTQRAAVQNLVANGIAVIVAAGNDATLEVSQQVPATYPEVIAIASTTAKVGTNSYTGFSGVIGADTASYFTTDGAFNSTTGIGVSISAPGETQEDISRAGYVQSVGILFHQARRRDDQHVGNQHGLPARHRSSRVGMAEGARSRTNTDIEQIAAPCATVRATSAARRSTVPRRVILLTACARE